MLIVGRHQDVRGALEIRLGMERDLLVVGSTSSLDPGSVGLSEIAPHVLLVDVDTDACCAADIARARREVPGLRVVMLVLEVDDEARRRAAASDGVQMVAKGMPADLLVDSIRRREDGRTGEIGQGFV